MAPTYRTHRPSLIEFCEQKAEGDVSTPLNTRTQQPNSHNRHSDEKTVCGLRERYDDEEGPVEALVLHEVSDEGDGLDGFPQTHLISKDAVQVVVIK